jgi:hypothetical protein
VTKRIDAANACQGSSSNCAATAWSPKSPRSRLYRVTRYDQQVTAAAIALHDLDYPVHYLSAA